MAKNSESYPVSTPDTFSDLSQALKDALDTVQTRKAAKDSALSEASIRSLEYTQSLQRAQDARRAFDAHLSEITTGFAEVHQ